MGWGQERTSATALADRLARTSADRVLDLERALAALIAAVEDDQRPDLSDRRLRSTRAPIDDAVAAARSTLGY